MGKETFLPSILEDDNKTKYTVNIEGTIVQNTLSPGLFGALVDFQGFPIFFDNSVVVLDFTLVVLQVSPFQPIPPRCVHIHAITRNPPITEQQFDSIKIRLQATLSHDWDE